MQRASGIRSAVLAGVAFASWSVLVSLPARAAVIVVNDSSDIAHTGGGCVDTGMGSCTLRDAISFATANPGYDEVHFAIPGAGVHTIVLDSGLENLAGELTIDGYTQPGASPNTKGDGLADNAVLLIEINGNGYQCFGVHGAGNLIRGLVINRCNSYAVYGVFLGSLGYMGYAVVEGNFIGTDPTGSLPRPNGGGVNTHDAGGVHGGFLVGGFTPAARNVISGNSEAGVLFNPLFAIAGAGTIIRGNFIGTDMTGTTALPNGGDGIEVRGAPVLAVEISNNVVSGNLGRGVSLSNASADLLGNLIGTDVSGTIALGNRSTGVWISDVGDKHSVINGNTIAYNGAGDPTGGGIVNYSASDHWYTSDPTLLGNSVFGNTSDGSLPGRGLGIDLVGPGPMPNDACNFTEEGERAQNFPVLVEAVTSGSTIRIRGALDSTPDTTFRIEFFGSPACDPSGYGEGKTFLGSADVTTDDSCSAPFDVTLLLAGPPGAYVTATATDASTSEFSPCQLVTHSPVGILSIAPTSGPPEGGTIVKVDGEGFQPGAWAALGGISAVGTVSGAGTELTTTAPLLLPGTLNDVSITNPNSSSARLPRAWMADFADVATSQLFHDAVERIFRAGITTGCAPGSYCPNDPVTRGQAAAFIARAMAGGGAGVPASGLAFGRLYDCTAGGVSLFNDVSPTDPFCKHVHYLAAQRVSLGCSSTAFCPGTNANREDIAALVAKAIVAPGGGAAVPDEYSDPVTGLSFACDTGSPPSGQHFADVPSSDPFCKHVHFLWAKGIISGCHDDPSQYCPSQGVDRGAMAKFLANAFTRTPGP